MHKENQVIYQNADVGITHFFPILMMFTGGRILIHDNKDCCVILFSVTSLFVTSVKVVNSVVVKQTINAYDSCH